MYVHGAQLTILVRPVVINSPVSVAAGGINGDLILTVILDKHTAALLRDAMNDALLELVDSCALAPVNRVTEIVGSRDARLATLLREIDTRTGLRVPDQ